VAARPRPAVLSRRGRAQRARLPRPRAARSRPAASGARVAAGTRPPVRAGRDGRVHAVDGVGLMSYADIMVDPIRYAVTTLRLQLSALAAQRGAPAFEVLVVDDASTDGTADVAGRHERMLPRLRVVRQQRRGGANAARNRGVDAATGALVLLCDADDRVAS